MSITSSVNVQTGLFGPVSVTGKPHTVVFNGVSGVPVGPSVGSGGWKGSLPSYWVVCDPARVAALQHVGMWGRIAGLLRASHDPGRYQWLRNADFTACRCALHTLVECGLPGEPGCRGMAPGTHVAVAGLYDAGHHACLAEPWVRAMDARFARMVEMGEGRVRRVPEGFFGGHGLVPERMGAGYCYLHLFPPKIGLRVARILGPLQFAVRIIPYYLAVGLAMPEVEWEEVAPGKFHVVKKPGVRRPFLVVVKDLFGIAERGGRIGASEDVDQSQPATDFGRLESRDSKEGSVARPIPTEVDRLKAVLRSVVDVEQKEEELNIAVNVVHATGCGLNTLGASLEEAFGPMRKELVGSPRALRLHHWLVDRGLVVGEETLAELVLVTYSSAELPAVFNDYKVRSGTFALLGDAVLKLDYCRWAVASRRTPAAISQASTMATNPSLASTFEACGLRSVCAVENLQAGKKATADVLEAVIGVLAYYEGLAAAHKLIFVLDLFPSQELVVPVDGREREELDYVLGSAIGRVTAAEIRTVRALKAAGLL